MFDFRLEKRLPITSRGASNIIKGELVNGTGWGYWAPWL